MSIDGVENRIIRGFTQLFFSIDYCILHCRQWWSGDRSVPIYQYRQRQVMIGFEFLRECITVTWRMSQHIHPCPQNTHLSLEFVRSTHVKFLSEHYRGSRSSGSSISIDHMKRSMEKHHFHQNRGVQHETLQESGWEELGAKNAQQRHYVWLCLKKNAKALFMLAAKICGMSACLFVCLSSCHRCWWFSEGIW